MSPLPATAQAFGHHANALLEFEVSGDSTEEDPVTGNPVPQVETLTYVAALKLQRPRTTGEAGTDYTRYSCAGRLLDPPTLDPRIQNGAHAMAEINGITGRFQIGIDLAVDWSAAHFIREAIQGTFEMVGGTLRQISEDAIGLIYANTIIAETTVIEAGGT
jgi:hypothetical protein